jgi:hypothetical protein
LELLERYAPALAADTSELGATGLAVPQTSHRLAAI